MRINYWVALIFLLLTPLGQARIISQDAEIFLQFLQSIQPDFVKTVEIPVSSQSTATEVAWGNSLYGYYKSSRFTVKNGKVHLKLLLPGYKKPITFFVRSNGLWKKAFTKKFNNPFPHYKKFVKTQYSGHMKSNYFMMETLFPLFAVNKPALLGIPSIINKYGEIVWLDRPFKNNRLSPKGNVMKRVSATKWLILNETRLIDQIDLLEGHSKIFKLSEHEPHHDLFLKGDILYFLSKSLLNFNNFKEFSFSQNAAIVTPGIMSINIKTEKITHLWSPTNKLNFRSLKIFNNTNKNRQKLNQGNFPVGKLSRGNIFHTNTLEPMPNGRLLISNSNDDSIIVLDKNYKIVSTIGGSHRLYTNHLNHKHATLRDGFSKQHSVKYFGPNQFLLFDNKPLLGSIPSRVIVIELYKDPQRGPLYKVIWEYPGNWLSPRAGTVAMIDPETVFTHFSADPKEVTYERLVEINYSSKKATGELNITLANFIFEGLEKSSLIYRIEPLLDLQGETRVSKNELPL